jgi:hypothetical protein
MSEDEFPRTMTTQEIQHYINTAIRSNFKDYIAEAGEMMTSEDGDGRFFGKVDAIRYSGLPGGEDIYLAIGQTDKQVQIIKLGNSECLKPSETDLDLLLLKELDVKPSEESK